MAHFYCCFLIFQVLAFFLLSSEGTETLALSQQPPSQMHMDTHTHAHTQFGPTFFQCSYLNFYLGGYWEYLFLCLCKCCFSLSHAVFYDCSFLLAPLFIFPGVNNCLGFLDVYMIGFLRSHQLQAVLLPLLVRSNIGRSLWESSSWSVSHHCYCWWLLPQCELSAILSDVRSLVSWKPCLLS